ncbi:hypothetical protein EIN_087450 [Entamoeba invadens IP1]|uniref:hypothetical protein n=1 Tax=Entamoeba invadens IP1 TaxID=370355 RepID=UPI0002C3FA2D|nr:hypothetical protein EIN_087450 [Entamoeba invadens IP1]ELP85433.1 hypothetical protein EIN_087450 [Entamoeba invadens IP1]|eukprot:XP_004184779.1 hypothetical protein EIN_087450 [Entamoeba invadens IP1]
MELKEPSSSFSMPLSNSRLKTMSAPKQPKTRPNKTSREIRNYQTLQQAVLIALLNQYAEVVFKQPAKKSVTTYQFMRIKSIKFTPQNTIAFNEFLKRRCVEHYTFDITNNTPMKTAKRRYQTNKKTDGIHLLMDLLTECGYFFVTKLTEGKSGTVKLDNIIQILKDGKTVVEKNELCKIGETVNEMLTKWLENSGKEMVLKRNNPDLAHIIVI